MDVLFRSRFAARRVAIALAGGIFAGLALASGWFPTVAGEPARLATWAAAQSISGAGRGSAGPPRTVSGSAAIVDGDTLDVGGRRIRLEGIDAPESGQTCPGRYVGGDLGPWRCGQAATAALARLTDAREVTCDVHETDRYKRLIATCFVDGRDINREMVRQGHAWAFIKYSASYVADEAASRNAGVGVWASRETPQPPWEYRARRWASAEQVAPDGCVIKGNVSARGERIYHTPWSPWYGKVRIEERSGERWFCDEAQAQAAGWRPSTSR